MDRLLGDMERQRALTSEALIRRTPRSGWCPASDTWTYASATSFTVAADYSTRIGPGDKVRLKQGGAYLYAVVVSATYSDPTTTVVLVFIGASMASATITDNYYSHAACPTGWPAGGTTVMLAAALTSTSWDGDAKNGASATLDLSTVFGVPAGVKAVYVQMSIVDETANVYARLGPDSAHFPLVLRTQVANIYSDVAGWVTCDANGDIYFSQEGELDGVHVYIWGYVL